MPMLPFLCIEPGMMPILHSPGVITPGQLGPMRRALYDFSAAFTFSMSTTGMPSVMQTMVEMRQPALARRDAAHQVRAVLDRLLRMKRALLAGETLADHARVLIDQDGHRFPPPPPASPPSPPPCSDRRRR